MGALYAGAGIVGWVALNWLLIAAHGTVKAGGVKAWWRS
jgi:hypothetical protein